VAWVLQRRGPHGSQPPPREATARRIATSLLLALLLPACAVPSRIPASRLVGWHAAESGRTRIVGDLAPEQLQKLASELARFDAIFAKLAGWPEGASKSPLAVYLFRDREVALRYGLGRGTLGWALGTLEGSFITVLISSAAHEDRNTLFHEYTHVLLAMNQRAPLPRWYNEGLATYFSTVSERDGAVIVGAAPAALAARVTHRGAFPLDRLFATSTSGMRWEEVGDFYATSWALSHYLLSSPSGRRELSAFVQQIARGVPSEEARRAAFGRSVEQLGEELSVHVSHLSRGVPIETLLDASSFATPEAPRVVALEPGEVAHALGTLALELALYDGRDDGDEEAALARDLLGLALTRNAPDAPRVEAALGNARAASGDASGALAAVNAALARAPDDPQVYRDAARVSLLRAESLTKDAAASAAALALAEQHSRRAVALAPESAAAWFGLGEALVRMERPDDAFAAFERARRFGWSRELDLALARLHLARGEREQAVALLLPIAQDPHGGPAQEEATTLLEQ
jgi:tetratricopeptide (TPR) repeat protein